LIITIDTQKGLLQSAGREYSLFSPEAFEILSRQWMVLGWNLQHWATFSWMGRQLPQFPDDVLRLAEVMWRVRPTVIIETGVHDGGATLLFAGLCERVIAIDRELRPEVRRAISESAPGRVTMIQGSSASIGAANLVARRIGANDRVCVFLDSDHAASHVAAELENFGPMVTPGCYLVVAGGNLPDVARAPHGDAAWIGDHPGRAVEDFLLRHGEFTRERPAPLYRAEFDFTQLSYFPATWLRKAEKL
jgi:cephalosporin hydroxylase